jgi:NAD(P) transhydrogenase subunit alpha
MTTELEIGLYIFMLAGFLGYHLITRVPPLLHTPLMSATNAIAGISLVGSLVVAGADYGPVSTTLGFMAVMCSATNVIGGFLITDRMLGMFKASNDKGQRGQQIFGWSLIVATAAIFGGVTVYVYAAKPAEMGALQFVHENVSTHALRYCYIVSAACFVMGLKGLSSPKWARRGVWLAELGMFLAIVGTLIHHEIVNYKGVGIGIRVGAAIGDRMELRLINTPLLFLLTGAWVA